MVGLEDLIPLKFKLDDSRGTWGLMARKWYEHEGCIDVDKVAAYIKEHKAYVEKKSDWSCDWITWSRDHRRCEADTATCSCPPQPRSPEKLVLEDYTTGEGEGEGVILWDVLEHPEVAEMCIEYWFIERGVERVLLETEARGGGPNQESATQEE